VIENTIQVLVVAQCTEHSTGSIEREKSINISKKSPKRTKRSKFFQKSLTISKTVKKKSNKRLKRSPKNIFFKIPIIFFKCPNKKK
jgi:hypothetical protein